MTFGAIDLYSGSRSLTGANRFHVDKNPLNEIFGGIEDVIGKQAGDLGANLVSGVIGYVQKIAGAIIDAILGLPLELLSSLEPALLQSFQNVDKFFTNVLGFLGGIDPLSELFSIEAAAETFISNVLADTGLLPILDGAGHLAQEALQPLIDAIAQAFGLSAGLSFSGLEAALLAYLSAIPGSVISGATVVEQAILDAIANALGHSGTGHTPSDILGYLAAFPASVITGALNATGVTVSGNPIGDLLSKLSAAGIYDAASGFANLSTSLLKNLTPTGGNLGNFDAAHIAGALNSAVTLQGQAVSALFNGSGQFIGVLNSAATGALNTAVTVGGVTLGNLFTNINSSGQLLLSGATGALNGAVTIGGTAVSTLATNWNAAVTDVNSLISGVGGSVIADVTNYLGNIPNTAVQGLLGFGANIGASVQALNDLAWQGLKLFIGTPAGITPTQVGGAATQVRVDLNNATDIATRARAIQAKDAITKSPFLSIDPSADSTFPLALINGVSPSTEPVVQTKSVMGVILLPDAATKKSVSWMGGPLTSILGVYVHLYKVNKTTGVFTKFHSSANVISSLSNPVSGLAWSFYNLPMADFFDVTFDGTGGSTTNVFAFGDYVVVEIQTIGSGTYNVAGLTNALPVHTSVYPKAIGASRVTGSNLWSASASYSAGTTKNPSINITPVAGDNCVVAQFDIFSSNSAVTAVSATYGGAAMTLLSLSANYRTGNFGYLATFGYINSSVGSGGTKAAVLTTTGGGTSGTQCGANGVVASLPGIASFGTAQTASATTGTSLSQTVTGAAEDIIWSAFTSGVGTLSAYSAPQIALLASAALTDTIVVGTVFGYGASVPITATQSASGRWAGVAVPLVPITSPLAPASISSPTYDSATPWIALVGSAGRSQHAAETVEFETAGSGQTYTVPAWVIDGDYIDIVPIGAGAGGSYAGSTNSPNTYNDTTYKGGGGGSWNPTRLRYGDAYDIPTGTTTFTVNVGAPGSAGAYPGSSCIPAHGSDGSNTTVVITGVPTITANGGTHDASTAGGGIGGGSPNSGGDTPGNVVHEGVTYFGGAVVIQNLVGNHGPTAGNGPGGGGTSGYSNHAGSVFNYSGASGAPGACYITAVQN